MQLKIAVCDDDDIALHHEVLIVKELCHEKGINAEIEQFISPNALLNRTEKYDIAILDIEMDEMDGISLAKRITETNPECYKIFITSYSAYLDNAFDVSAIRYLNKPVDKDRLGSGIDTIIDRIASKHKMLYITRQKNKLPSDIEISTILYIETAGRHTKIVSYRYGEFEVEEVFSNVKKMIEKEVNYFCQPQQSFFVNLNYVVNYTKTTVTLAYAGNTYEVAMSRRRYNTFKESLFKLVKKIL